MFPSRTESFHWDLMLRVEHHFLSTRTDPNSEDTTFSFQSDALNENLLNGNDTLEQSNVDGWQEGTAIR